MIPLGILSATGSNLASQPYLLLFASVTTIYTTSSTTTGGPAALGNSFSINVEYVEPTFTPPYYDQYITLEGTYLDGLGNPVEGVYVSFSFDLGNESIQTSPDSTNVDGKISTTFASDQWVASGFNGATITAIHNDGVSLSSGTGQIILSSS